MGGCLSGGGGVWNERDGTIDSATNKKLQNVTELHQPGDFFKLTLGNLDISKDRYVTSPGDEFTNEASETKTINISFF